MKEKIPSQIFSGRPGSLLLRQYFHDRLNPKAAARLSFAANAIRSSPVREK